MMLGITRVFVSGDRVEVKWDEDADGLLIQCNAVIYLTDDAAVEAAVRNLVRVISRYVERKMEE